MTIQERNGRHQLRVKSKLLPGGMVFYTFDTHEEADAYGQHLRKMLKKGVVPAAILEKVARVDDPLVLEVIREYSKSNAIPDSDEKLLDVIVHHVPGVRMSAITTRWVDEYVRARKLVDNNAPSTIRKKVGLMARIVDWHLRLVTPKDKPIPINPLRTLPRGYAVYNREDVKNLGEGLVAKRDVERNRRLEESEAAAIRAVLGGLPRTERHGALQARPDHLMLFNLIVDTGLRLLEAYSLRSDQLELERGFIHVDGSKGRNGVLKPRTVPLKREQLKVYSEGKVGRLFPFWDGTKEGKKIATRDLVQVFGRAFAFAGVEDLKEHDLRHEACCRPR
ncbi:tyrosine-type recombinase/integrase [Variovorax sp. LT1R16]|uniref:tyrosine-type recombinase/integrase n=1 Tax=Variovorax sp. LT1R16 TaxID=3443728 RepID=UPI003F44A0FE